MFKTIKHFKQLEFLKIAKTRNFSSLFTASPHLQTQTPQEALYSHNFMAQQQTHQLEVPFGVLTGVGPLHFFPACFSCMFITPCIHRL